MSVYITDLAVPAIFLLAGFGIGFRTYILIQLPELYIEGLTGFWLFLRPASIRRRGLVTARPLILASPVVLKAVRLSLPPRLA